jgi:hypothetical protein
MRIDKTQLTVLIVSTLVTLAVLVLLGGGGFPPELRQFNPEIIAYAFARSVGSSILCLLTFFVFAVSDLVTRKRRFVGWLICCVASVLIIFVARYILPPIYA